ncbi:MAG: 2Fe-2S iron-sulfur cluster-binding protein, partial [Acidimicrobiia bacterium]
MTRFELNGTPVEVQDGHPHLLAALREELDVTSPKDGCSPSGQCGACTILVDGKARVSCQMDVDKAEGTSIVTLEGLSDWERDRFADAFAAYGATQCGFCTPGIIMRSKALIDKKGADLTRGDLQRHLGANLCRCTGYLKVFAAIEAVAHGDRIEVASPGGVGSTGVKYEARELALGTRGYVDDLKV